QPEKARIVGLQFGKESITDIDYKNIMNGAILQVNSGDKVPVDGEIISGEAAIDESMITGESIPAERVSGSKVIGGTVLLSGNFRMRAETVGNETVLAKIIELVKKAQQNKPSIQKLGDKVSAIFVPVVLSISILTFLIAFFFLEISMRDSMMRSIAVLVISCPCAMGLATPTAVMVGIGRAAKKGILIKGGDTLEQLAVLKNIVFDKTGTLTTGNFKINKIHLYNSNMEEVKDILFQLEQHSSHPIAKSMVKELKGCLTSIQFLTISEEKGKGVFAKDTAQNYYSVGSFGTSAHLTDDRSHSVYLIKNDQLIASVDLRDDLKENTPEMVQKFNQLGMNTILLSGDKREKCEEIASALKMKKVYSEQSPEQKSKIIDDLVKLGPTAMVGDGINDAPALAKATIGISMSSATHVAIESAQVILLKHNDLRILIEAQLIGKHTLITIKQNLFWAFFYNVVAIPVAAMGLLNPMAGALAMAFSDVIVIGNSIRLKTKKLS
ncbi:MAG: cadmium-translocating P-type ATPase, partial [Bacteroidota bacterium]|nr:cadmium-translocating P-type ATPase [Bacteroidota bacterium]